MSCHTLRALRIAELIIQGFGEGGGLQGVFEPSGFGKGPCQNLHSAGVAKLQGRIGWSGKPHRQFPITQVLAGIL